MVLTLGGVHKIQILIRDLLKEFLQQIFGEEMGGSGEPRPPYVFIRKQSGALQRPYTAIEGPSQGSIRPYELRKKYGNIAKHRKSKENLMNITFLVVFLGFP